MGDNEDSGHDTAVRYDSSGWGEGASGWVENEALFDSVYTPVTKAIVDAADFGPSMRALDVGCGSGTLLAAGTAAGAEMVGVDIAPDMVDAARRRVPAATVLLGDAQTMNIGAQAPGAPFERVVSRFGVMFFDDPTAAFANIRGFAAPGSRLVFACWRGVEENPTFGGAGTDVITAELPDPPVPPAPGQPGPVAFADHDYLRKILKSAEWSDIKIEPFDTRFDHGVDGSDGVDERLTLIQATTTGRLAREQLTGRLSESEWADLLERARDGIREYLVDGSVKLPGAMWLVTATNRE
ncbi:putative methyltransferase [Gordonia araii NBRC 100433]|uniref:Putative methyltransferase n=1 Tax=Gordonia araii NBRC 100433 TaxID=1073574 RepID=G7GY45_9ACTN|nr:class I SAM-dependent methyltransferase [Gordonia araii]NNG98131.1 class I SAM-dependent methyltransferase [Gordonia araii NBRC 100433]GAB08520.1 putative methyltransferase [Gordonia araii NBRC 100433]